MTDFIVRKMTDRVRCRWIYDEDYQTVGSYGLDSEEETKAAEDHEIAKLGSEEWLALGCIVEHLCPTCGGWTQGDSLWGIVIKPEMEAIDTFARDSLDLRETDHQGMNRGAR